ncbi:MAG: replicative DNA helicase [Oscillospiraceae bacterium]|nr:replicative DNA helicase [Oscillospiraceae bacterium]
MAENTSFNDIEMPYSLEAEQTVLGAILINQDVLSTVLESVKPECFYIDQHRALFTIMVQMFTSGEKADVVTVLNAATSAHIFETAQEGRNYLGNLVNMVPTVSNIESYCSIVVNKYYIRSLAEVARGILSDIQSGETDASLLLDAAEQRIYDIRQGKATAGLTPIREVVAETYTHVGQLAGPDREQYLGIRSGFSHLDAITSGLNKSDLILIAARPAMGKTAFALNIAQNVAAHAQGKEVCIFSLEMSSQQLVGRLLSSAAQVDSNKLRSGRLSGDDWIRLAAGACFLNDLPIYIDATAGITVPQIKAKLRRMKNLGLVVIDYLGLIQTTLRTDNRVQIVSEITRQLKIMAKELDVPVILLSQLSRGPESRTDKRPMLSDLRESGSIEQDADIVMFLYRDYYYNKEKCQNPNEAECIVAKNRHGEVGTIKLNWDGQFTRFTTLETSDAPA